ncbi:MAG: PAS domain S-box protein [Thermoleophilia bacterium]|nr:PAS domain S-box protein [Thermoleophilia bacterium]
MTTGTAVLVAVRDDAGAVRDFRYEVVSPDAAILSGRRTPGEMVGRGLFELFPGLLSTPIGSALVRAVDHAEPVEGELHYDEDGVSGRFRIHALAVGEMVVMSISDITAEWRAAEHERRARRRLQAAMDASVGAVKILEAVRDEDGVVCDLRVVDASRHAAEVLGAGREEVVGRLVGEMYPPERAALIVAGCAGVLETGEVWETDDDASGGDALVRRRVVRLGDGQVVMSVTDVGAGRRAEIALRRERERQAALLEAMQDGLMATDAGGVMTDCNRAFARMTGLPRASILGAMPPHPWWSTADALRLAEVYAGLPPGARAELDLTLHAADGVVMEVTISATALAADDGTAAGYLGTVRDVSARRRAEGELRASRAAYRALSEGSPDVIMRMGRDQRIVYANRAWSDATGLAAGEAIGRRAAELPGVSPALAERWEHEAALVFAHGVERRYEYAIASPRGERWYQAHMVPERAADGQVSGVIVVSRDITEHRREETLLREERDRRATLIETMQDGLLAVGADGFAVTEVNQRLLEMTGFAREELTGTRPPYPFWPEEEIPHLRPALAQVRVEGVGEFDQVWRRRDGGRIPVIVATAAVHDDHGRLTGFISTVKDATVRRRQEEDLRASREAYRALAESIPDAIVRLGRDLRCQVLNGVAARLAGLPAEAAVGATLAGLGLAALEGDCRAVLAAGAGREVVLDLVPGARLVTLVVPEHGPSGEVEQLLVVVRDAAGIPAGDLRAQAPVAP